MSLSLCPSVPLSLCPSVPLCLSVPLAATPPANIGHVVNSRRRLTTVLDSPVRLDDSDDDFSGRSPTFPRADSPVHNNESPDRRRKLVLNPTTGRLYVPVVGGWRGVVQRRSAAAAAAGGGGGGGDVFCVCARVCNV